jgi:oleandomycin transport system ATP-binding protein
MRFGKVKALDGLDLTAPAGKVLAILGPNGAGKTTLVRAVSTLLRPTGGALHVLGRDVSREPEASQARHRSGRSVRGGRADHDRPREPGDDGQAVRPQARRGSARRVES